MVTKQELIELKQQGLTYAVIGQRFSISRQRVHQLLTGYKSPSTLSTPETRRRRNLKARRRRIFLREAAMKNPEIARKFGIKFWKY